jgi:hypothetical protein
MSPSAWSLQPIVDSVVAAIEDIVGAVPPSRERAVKDPSAAAHRLARKAAARAAALSGTLALPPGVLGMLTVLPDLVAIWRIQSQMVADIAGLYAREVELTRTHMMYCLFRHAATQLARDVVVRAGERVVIRQLSGAALRNAMTTVGLSMTQRVVGTGASRWVPLIGAAAVAGYAYFDTIQVAKTAIRMLQTPLLTEDDAIGAAT